MRVRERPLALWVLILVLSQLAVRAFVGGTALVLDPSGAVIGLSPRELDPLPFETFRVPGLVLASALGVYPAVACYWLAAGRPRAWFAATSVGLVLLCWLLVEAVTGFDRPTMALNLGTAVAALGLSVHPAVRDPSSATDGREPPSGD